MKIFFVQVIAFLLFAIPVFSGPPKRLIKHEKYENDTLAEHTHYYYKSYYGYNPTWEKVYDKNELRENFYLNLKPNNNLFDSAVLQHIKFVNPGSTTYYSNYFDAFHRPILQIDSSTEQEITYKSTYEYTTDDQLSFYSNFSYSKWGKQGYFLNFEVLNHEKWISNRNWYFKTDTEEASGLDIIDTFYFENHKLAKQFTNFIKIQNNDYASYLQYNDQGVLSNIVQYRFYTPNDSIQISSANYIFKENKLLKEMVSPLKSQDDGLPELQSIYYYSTNYYPDSSYHRDRMWKYKYYYKYDDENYLVEKTTKMPTNLSVHTVEKFYYEPFYPTSTQNADGLDDFYIIQNVDNRYINIKSNLNLESDVEIFMYNLEGKTVYTTHLASSNILNHSIYKDGFSKGIYFIRVNTIQGSRVQKILIN